MTVNNLDTPERGSMDLNTRDPKGTEKVNADIARVKKGGPSADQELEALRARVAAAKESPTAVPANMSCAHCFRSGWAEAVKAIEG